LLARNCVFYFDQSLIEQRLGAVTFGEVEKKFPPNGLVEEEAKAVCFFLAGDFGACG
jgi:hypothetical protein